MNKIQVGTLIIISALVVAGCSKLEENLSPPASPISAHGSGWTDSTSSNFHGKDIRNNNWDMRQCRACHGAQYDGGTVGVSCRTCHNVQAGPENCATCHGSPTSPAPPRDLDNNTSRTARGVGVHQIHLVGGAISNGVSCSDCHNVPGSVYVPGHVDSPQPAEVPMSGFLPQVVTNETTTVDWDPTLPVFTPQPAYSAANLSCSNTYCHGHFKNGNDTLVMMWTDTTVAAAACGTCHGDVTITPPDPRRALPKTLAQGGTHPNVTACSNCHIGVVDANLNIIDKTKHINGKLNVFNEERDF
jgi:predicted CxxxxCH...CXXCH cytochrome family protein